MFGDQAGPPRGSLSETRDILDELTNHNVTLSLCGSIHDPTDRRLPA
jgi:hypothetical protein